MAIVQYVAEQHGLYGSNIEERGIINCVLASIKELFDEAADISVFTPEEEEKVSYSLKCLVLMCFIVITLINEKSVDKI